MTQHGNNLRLSNTEGNEMNSWKNVLKKAIIVIQIALPTIALLVFFDTGPTSGHPTAESISLYASMATLVMTALIALILLVDSPFCIEEKRKKIVMDIREIIGCTFVAILLFAPVLGMCFSEISSDDYIALEERISSSGGQAKEVVKSALKKDKVLSGWTYMSILKELNRIDSIKKREERDREMAKEKEEAKAALLKAINRN
jgi:hypothetical protein